MVGGVAEQPRANREPDTPKQRDERSWSEVGDQECQRPEAKHYGNVVGDRRVAVGKPPGPWGHRNPEGQTGRGQRTAVVDVGQRESFHSVTSSSGRAKTAKSRYMAGST